jgi:para-nitrobenzyl esterase
MHIASTMSGIAMLLATSLVPAQTPPAQNPPAQAAAPQTAKYDVATTRLGVLLADAAAKAVLAKYIPQLIDSPDLQQATSMSLKDMQQSLQAYAPDLLSNKVLVQIQDEFEKLPPKQ